MDDYIDGANRAPEDFTCLEEKDPEYRYRFVQNRPGNIARKKSRGYEFVRADEEDVRPLFDHDHKRGDGLIHFADTILMRIPKGKQEARRRAKRQRAIQMLQRPSRTMKDAARDHGVELYDREED